MQAKFLISGCKEKKTLLRFGLQNRLNQILSNSVKEGALFKKKKVEKIEFEVSAGDERLLPVNYGQARSKFNPFKDLQSDQIQRSSRKIFIAHYACRNADLNLTLVMGWVNGFVFQIINSLIESWGVRLNWLDCKARSTHMYQPMALPLPHACALTGADQHGIAVG